METEVEVALGVLLDVGDNVTCDRVKEILGMGPVLKVPAMPPLDVDLGAYDLLLAEATA